MRHETLDAFAHGSRFNSIDPRVKLVSIVFLIVVLSFLSDPLLLGGTFVISLFLLSVSSIPRRHLIRHYLLAFPFIAFSSLSLYLTSGSDPGFNLFLRTSTAVMLLLFVGSTTPFFDLLKGLQHLRVPSLNVIMLFFIYRYIFIIWDEMERMERARMARGFVKKGNMFNRHLFSGIIGTAGMILVRSYERGRRSYRALMSRGFQGEVRTLRSLSIKPFDIAFCIPIVAYSIIIGAIEMGVVG